MLRRLVSTCHQIQRTSINSLERNWLEKLKRHAVENPEGSLREIKLFAKTNYEKHGVTMETLFDSLCQRRFKREPLQYIIGEWDFRSINLAMKQPVFIPRPETEGLVDLINSHLLKQPKSSVLEIGCGSGAVTLALLRENEQISCVAIDNLKEAVMLTGNNADRLGLDNRLTVLHEDFRSDFIRGEPFDVIVCNPPYVPRGQIECLQEEVKNYEHLSALDGGEDGLDVVRDIVERCPQLLKRNGHVFLEVDVTHAPLVRLLVAAPQVPLKFVRSHHDCYGRERFCELQLI